MLTNSRRLILTLVCFSILSFCQHGMAANWPQPAHTWGGSQNDSGSAVALDSDGNAYVVGWTNSFGAGGQDVLLTKYDPTGIFLWAKTWGGSGDEFGAAARIGPDGYLYIAGATSSFGSGSYDLLLLKLDTDGNLQWAQTWGGDSYDVGYDLAFDSGNNVYVAGETYSSSPCCSAVVVEFDPSGTLLHALAYKGPANYDSGYSLTIDSSSNVILVGTSWDYSSYATLHTSLLVIKYDSNQNLLWQKNWASAYPGQDQSSRFQAVVTDTNNNIYIAGNHSDECKNSDFSQCDFDASLLELDSDGNFLRANRWGVSGTYEASGSVLLSTSNQLLLSGVKDAFGVPELFVLGYDTTGDLLSQTGWTNGSVQQGPAAGMALDGAGNFYLASFALNNAGSWGAVNAAAGTLPNSLTTNSYSTFAPSETTSQPTNPTVSQNGTSDTGGGGADLFIAQGLAASSAPAVELTPSYLVFSSSQSTLPLTVTNSGTAALIVTVPQTFSGFNSFDFSVASGTTCTNGAVVEPGDSCTINITFTPLTNSAEAANLLLYDNASNSPQTVPLSGGAPLASISPNPIPGSKSSQIITVTGIGFEDGAVLNWKDLTTGEKGPVTPLSVTSNQLTASLNFTNATAAWQIDVKNPGQKASNWFSFEVLGRNYAYVRDDYPFHNAAFCPVNTPPPQCKPDTDDPYGFFYRECTSYVAWRMNRDAGTTNPTFPYFLNGMGNNKCPDCWGKASNWAQHAKDLGYNFDATPEVGDIAQWVTGCGDGCDGGHVAYVEQVNQDGSIIVSEFNFPESDSLNHQFGVRTILANDKKFPQNFIHILYLNVSTNLLNFGNEVVNSDTYLPVTLTNPGNTAVQMEAITITGKNKTDFKQTNTCGSSIPAGGNCVITVTFAPSATGLRSGMVKVRDIARVPIVQTINLTGTGT